MRSIQLLSPFYFLFFLVTSYMLYPTLVKSTSCFVDKKGKEFKNSHNPGWGIFPHISEGHLCEGNVKFCWNISKGTKAMTRGNEANCLCCLHKVSGMPVIVSFCKNRLRLQEVNTDLSSLFEKAKQQLQ